MSHHASSEIQELLLTVSEDTKTRAKALWPKLAPHLREGDRRACERTHIPPEAQEEIYAADEARFQALFERGFDDQYIQTTKAAVSQIVGSGMSINTYLTGYQEIVQEFCIAVANSRSRNRDLSTVVECCFFDASVAVSMFMDEVETKSQTERQQLADEFQQQVQKVISEVNDVSRQIGLDSNGLLDQANESSRKAAVLHDEVGAAMEEYSGNLKATTESAEQLDSSMGNINEHVTQGVRAVEESSERTERAKTNIDQLSQAAHQINNLIKLIEDIAQQTNLLALNATIEAARAGEAGKGFAVVASEVKALADQSQKTAESVTRQIGQINELVNTSVTDMDALSTLISGAGTSLRSVASVMEEQTDATQEMARRNEVMTAGADHLHQALDEILDNTKTTTQANISSSNEIVEHSRLLENSSKILSERTEEFLHRLAIR